MNDSDEDTEIELSRLQEQIAILELQKKVREETMQHIARRRIH